MNLLKIAKSRTAHLCAPARGRLGLVWLPPPTHGLLLQGLTPADLQCMVTLKKAPCRYELLVVLKP